MQAPEAGPVSKSPYGKSSLASPSKSLAQMRLLDELLDQARPPSGPVSEIEIRRPRLLQAPKRASREPP